MKKKLVITWILVCSFVFCAVPAFAQQKLTPLTAKTVERDIIEIEEWGGSVQFYNPDGQKYDMKLVEKLVSSSFVLRPGGYMETGKDGYAYIFGVNTKATLKGGFTSWIGGLSGQIFLKVGPNSRIEQSRGKKANHAITITKGTWSEDKGAKKLVKFDELMIFLSGVNSQKIRDQVAKWKSGGKFASNDALANHIIAQKSAKGGFLGAVVGLGGALTLPAEFAAVLSSWVIQSEMAYALACVYQAKPPTQAEFKTDLYMLLCGDGILQTALKVTKSESTLAKGQIIGKAWTKQLASNIQKKVIEEMAKQMTQEMVKKGGQSSLKAIPVVGSVVGGVSDFSGAASFGDRAKKYYRN